ncbi:PEP/pyruvate-binding domain-containing protein [Yoonia sp.]|uniref:PEP/pyruvate-binding domain-containing protein n=1 Tax=Yoonia sp. TaxID=2212373 RepID=UPI0019E14BC4|nr:PEP/pyruvate-binding domain-containing protein [Yoonia sp.]MBE0413711.1 phosphoenolpyruvate synthase [Yoonia sp.]
MTEKFILPFDRITAADHDRVGGKCASLGEMTRHGVAVPPGFAITTEAYAEMLAHQGLHAEIAALLDTLDPDDVVSTERVARNIETRVRSHPMPAHIEQAIRDAYTAMGGDLAVAVRSSATAEDLPDASFAGQQDTYLWVIGADQVVEKVRDCWGSLFTARAIAYRAKAGLGQIEVLMSVAVQKMVNARVAGVAMTLNPTTGDRTKIVIDASWGLGELVVSGVVTPDNFTVEKVLMEVINRKIGDKHLELVGDATAGATIERPVDADRRASACMTDAEVIAVAALAKRLEKQNGCPQDVEWAIDADLPDGENLLALQSRPETVWSQKKTAAKPKASYAVGMAGIVGTLNNPLGSKT